MSLSSRESGPQQQLAVRIRAECSRRGWSLGELARRAGIARGTLHNLERGRTDRPHIETLRKIADALGLSIEVLQGEQPPRAHARRSPVTGRPPHSPAAQDFDSATNPAVAEVMREQPHLFAGWNQSDVDELVSLFGTGGGLTPRGVELAAESINRRRETVFKLQVVLETHLGKEAMEMVDMLYRLVQPPQMREPGDST